MADPIFHLKSTDGRRLAVRRGALTLLSSDDGQTDEFLTITGTPELNGFSASHLVSDPAAKRALAMFFLVKGSKPGTVRVLNDQAFLHVTDEGLLALQAGKTGSRGQFELVSGIDRVATLVKPSIWIKPIGNVGNRALGYLVAERIRQLVPNAEIQNVYLPEWGLDKKSTEPPPAGAVRTGGWDRFWIDIFGFSDCLRRRVMDTLILDSCCFRLDHYPKREECRALLGTMKGGESATGFGPNQLVCSVRANEILEAKHPWYFPLPAGYYELLQKLTGLELVFYGQIGNDSYSDSLRTAFPHAKFIPGRSAAYDFETLRKSRNIAISISTFAWLAAWLSDADCVYVPFGGIFNPVLHGTQDFLPLDDASFHYILLPYVKPVSVLTDNVKFSVQQASIATSLRIASSVEINQIVERATLMKPREPYVGGFEHDFYVSQTKQALEENQLNYL